MAANTLPPAAQAYDMATDLRYEQLNTEIRTIKVQLATMNQVQSKEMLFEKVTKTKPLIDRISGIRVSSE